MASSSTIEDHADPEQREAPRKTAGWRNPAGLACATARLIRGTASVPVIVEPSLDGVPRVRCDHSADASVMGVGACIARGTGEPISWSCRVAI